MDAATLGQAEELTRAQLDVALKIMSDAVPTEERAKSPELLGALVFALATNFSTLRAKQNASTT
jgi:hypothetical protein